jgi:amino acid transporter
LRKVTDDELHEGDLQVTVSENDAASAPGLRRNALGLPEVVFQGMTHIAPSLNIVFTFPLIALKAGPAMPLSFVLTTIVCLFIANTVSQFARFMPSSGGYYAFATRGLGARFGFMTTWSYLIYDFLGMAGAIGFLGYLASNALDNASGVNVPWWLFALLTFLIVWVLTYRGIAVSIRTTAVLGAVEILIMLALAITFLVHPGHGSSYTAPLFPKNAPNHFHGVLAGMVFSVLALSGFEAPAPLAQETRRPAKFISRAVLISLLIIGCFYIFTAYASAIGWGTGRMAAFASNPNPYYALGHSLWGAGWWFILFAIINSTIGVGLACTNAATRVMYTMGQAGTLPRQFGRLHPVYQSPTFAISVQQLVGVAAVLIVGLGFGATEVFGFIGTIDTLAVIVLYIMANLALIRYVRREQAAHFDLWRHVIAPLIGTGALVPVLWVTVWPEPSWPINLTPYIFVAIMAVGFALMLLNERRHPGVLLRSAEMLTENPIEKEPAPA